MALQLHAKALGFDWSEPMPVFDKVLEELDEVKDAFVDQSASEMHEELGDLLFAVINLSRHLQVDPTSALAQANEKFSQRFTEVEALAEAEQINMLEADLETLEALWRRVKQKNRNKWANPQTFFN